MARASKHRGLLTEAVRLVEESLSDYQLSKETKELDERLERLQRQQTSVETNPEATPENTAAAFRKTWKTAVLLAEVGQTQTAKQAKQHFVDAMHLVVPQFSVDKITLEDIRHDVAVSSNEICLALTHLGDYFQTHESDNKQAEVCYREVLRKMPNHFAALGNLANLLHKCRRNVDETEALYQRVMDLYPEHSATITRYGNWLKMMKKDYAAAEHVYKKAIEADPENPDALGSLAVLMHGVLQQFDKAETYYERAIQACDYHTNNLSNFALFLADVRVDYDRAEALYKQALKSSPTHANTLYNYGVLMDSIKRYDDAENLFSRAIEANPSHAYAMYNLAVLKEDIRQDLKEAGRLYSKAAEAAPKDVSIALDYASFLWKRLNNIENAQDAFASVFKVLGREPPANVKEIPQHLRSLKTQARDDTELALQRYAEYLRGSQIPRFS